MREKRLPPAYTLPSVQCSVHLYIMSIITSKSENKLNQSIMILLPTALEEWKTSKEIANGDSCSLSSLQGLASHNIWCFKKRTVYFIRLLFPEESLLTSHRAPKNPSWVASTGEVAVGGCSLLGSLYICKGCSLLSSYPDWFPRLTLLFLCHCQLTGQFALLFSSYIKNLNWLLKQLRWGTDAGFGITLRSSWLVTLIEF